MAGRPWAAAAAGGIALTVRLTPKGGRDCVDGIEETSDGRPVLKVRVRAAPSDGEANDALVRLIAKALGVPPRAVELISGHTARVKRLKIDGSAIALAEALERICSNG
ncbi:MAG TPA: DUF167 family protein [Xanthobacteraceae bacterium]|nr:DUF167 family protein [Xanthobacteraceae bacterium]